MNIKHLHLKLESNQMLSFYLFILWVIDPPFLFYFCKYIDIMLSLVYHFININMEGITLYYP